MVNKGGRLKVMRIVNYLGFSAFFVFILFFIVSLIIGGEAGNGFVKDGQYFVSEHGKITQVSVVVWYISKILGDLVFFLMFSAIFSKILYCVRK